METPLAEVLGILQHPSGAWHEFPAELVPKVRPWLTIAPECLSSAEDRWSSMCPEDLVLVVQEYHGVFPLENLLLRLAALSYISCHGTNS